MNERMFTVGECIEEIIEKITPDLDSKPTALAGGFKCQLRTTHHILILTDMPGINDLQRIEQL